MLDPQDQSQRDTITSELDRNVFVEAAAGTGKTTCLVRRMVNLIRTGRCTIDHIAAVTFTRKAAAELRTRFAVELENAAADPDSGEDAERLEQAVDQIEQCFIGTIHAFCARILRERPIEAGVDPDFHELSEADDQALRQQAWREHVDALLISDTAIVKELEDVGIRLTADDRPTNRIASELEELGLEAAELGPAFMDVTRYPEVREWPTVDSAMPSVDWLRSDVETYVQHMASFSFPEERGNDKLMSQYEQIVQKAKHCDTSILTELMGLLAAFRKRRIVLKCWPTSEIARTERDRYTDFRETRVTPTLRAWRQHRYQLCMAAILPARKLYDQLKSKRSVLNFADLLIRAARLLKNNRETRTFFRERFSHILVDEFQDTDPVQAEVILLLTSTDCDQADWRRCEPIQGSLFVVGDPRQSIYRFRRADIQIFNDVRSIMNASGGIVATLTSSFRSRKPIIDFANRTFSKLFPEKESKFSPAYTPLAVSRTGTSDDSIRRLMIPADIRNAAEAAEYEAGVIAQDIRRILDSQSPRRQSEDDDEPECDRRILPSDFLLVGRYATHFSTYGSALRRQGIPCEIVGGGTLCKIPELRSLQQLVECVSGARCQTALLAVLRGECFGFSDVQLNNFVECGGTLSYHSPIPKRIGPADRKEWESAFSLLQHFERLMFTRSPARGVQQIAEESGLLDVAAGASDGNIRLGSLMKAIDLCRSNLQNRSAAATGRLLARLVDDTDRHSTIEARQPVEKPARIMTLHQCKGLEAPYVFLISPSGDTNRPVDCHVNRTREASGYLPIRSQARRHGERDVLAEPADWPQLEAIEKNFLEAEKTRLLYVAVTRAGNQLTISMPERPVGKNPWEPLRDDLAECPTVAASTATLKANEDQSREEVIPNEGPHRPTEFASKQETWAELSKATYALSAMKDEALAGRREKPRSRRPQGREWGDAVHELIQHLAEFPGTDVGQVATECLRRHDLDRSLADEMMNTISNVTSSQLWTRAMDSHQRLSEVPMVLTRDAETPTISRGVIDLAFRAREGWVIVDFKTERLEGSDIELLAEYYTAQLKMYSKHWTELTEERVTEIGIFFCNTGQYVIV